MAQPRDAVFYEQEESRGIRTANFALWRRLEGTGEAALYDMRSDPGQEHNLAGNPDYRDTVEALSDRLEAFFARYSNPRYDLWRGGVAKGSVVRPGLFRRLYGDDWKPVTEMAQPFREEDDAGPPPD
jgi:hypothetical protein